MQEILTKSPQKSASKPIWFNLKDIRIWVGALAACFIVFTGWSLTRSVFDLDQDAHKETVNTTSSNFEESQMPANPADDDGSWNAAGLTQRQDMAAAAPDADYSENSSKVALTGESSVTNAGSDIVATPVPGQIANNPNQKLIRTGTYVLQADAPSVQAQLLIDLAVGGYQGFVQDSRISSSEDYWYPDDDPIQTAYITLRIPSALYDQFRSDISQLKDVKIISESLTGNDVTGEYVDLEARIKNLQAEEQQLQQLLNRATTIDEMLKVRNQISSTRSSIESLTAQLKSMSSQVDYSTFTITIKQTPDTTEPEPEPEPKWSLREVLKEAWDNLIEDYQKMIEDMTEMLVSSLILAPFALVLLIIVLVLRSIIKRKNTKKK